MWGLYHIHAYTNSIVSVMNLKPYSDTNCSIYGHYGLIYFPFVKVLGNDTRAILIVVGMFAVLTYLLTFYVLDNLILNDRVFCMATIAVIGTTGTYFGAGNYFQILPQRTLLPALAVAVVTFLENSKISGISKFLLEMVFGTVAIVFNLEMGLVALIIIGTYEIIRTDFALFKIAKKVFIIFVYFAACFLLAYIWVNVYNICVGGSWNTIKTFIYPIGSEQYNMSEILRTPIQNPFTGYALQIIVFSLALFSAIWHIWAEKQKTKTMLLQAALSTSGLASLVYFMNRSAASCLAISHIQFVAVLFIFADRIFNNIENTDVLESNKINLKYIAKNKWPIIACFLAFYFSLESIASIGMVVDNRSSSTWEKESLNEDYINVEKWISKNVKAFGMGVPEIFYQCGIDPQIYVTDWAGADMTSKGLGVISSVLQENSEIIISSETLDRSDVQEMLNSNGYNEADRFEGTNFTLVYLKR